MMRTRWEFFVELLLIAVVVSCVIAYVSFDGKSDALREPDLSIRQIINSLLSVADRTGCSRPQPYNGEEDTATNTVKYPFPDNTTCFQWKVKFSASTADNNITIKLMIKEPTGSNNLLQTVSFTQGSDIVVVQPPTGAAKEVKVPQANAPTYFVTYEGNNWFLNTNQRQAIASWTSSSRHLLVIGESSKDSPTKLAASKTNSLIEMHASHAALEPCEPNPCANGGTCALQANDAKCTCATQWEGPYCRTRKDFCPGTKKCSNGNGDCNEATGACVCKGGWKGASCNQSESIQCLKVDLEVDDNCLTELTNQLTGPCATWLQIYKDIACQNAPETSEEVVPMGARSVRNGNSTNNSTNNGTAGGNITGPPPLAQICEPCTQKFKNILDSKKCSPKVNQLFSAGTRFMCTPTCLDKMMNGTGGFPDIEILVELTNSSSAIPSATLDQFCNPCTRNAVDFVLRLFGARKPPPAGAQRKSFGTTALARGMDLATRRMVAAAMPVSRKFGIQNIPTPHEIEMVGMLMKGACMKDGAAYCFSNANFTAMFASKTSSLSFDANGFALLCEPKSTPQRCMQQAFHQIYRPILVAGLSNSSRETLESIIEDICFTPDGVTPCSSITPNEGMVRSCLANYTGNITCCKSFVFQWLKKVDNFTKSNPVLAADLFGANNAQLVSSGVAALSNCSNFTTCSAPTATQVVSFKLNGVSMANIEKNRAKYTDAVKRDVISTGVSPATIKKIDFTAATAGHRFQVLADAVTVSVTFQGYGNQANAAKVAFETTASSSAWVPASLVEQYSEENPGAQITVVKSTPTPPSPPPTAPPTPTAPTTPSKPPSPPLSPGKSAALTNSLAPSMLIVFALAALMLAA